MTPLKNTSAITVLMVVSFLLTGCNQSLNSIAPSQPPRALPSAPADPVVSNQLPPINADQQLAGAPTTADNLTPAPDAADSLAPSASTITITREALAGSWLVPTDSLDCRIILAFTKWSGGYRAATRKCLSLEIQAVNAWDVKDQSVVLVDQTGNEVARLFATVEGRYDGRTASGEPVSFTR